MPNLWGSSESKFCRHPSHASGEEKRRFSSGSDRGSLEQNQVL